MTNRLLAGLLGALLLISTAQAQTSQNPPPQGSSTSGDEWDSFTPKANAPAPSPATSAPTPATPAPSRTAPSSTPGATAPAQTPRSAVPTAPAARPSSPPATKPNATKSVAPVSPAPGKAVPSQQPSGPEGEAKLVRTKEFTLGGPADHSPSTLHNEFTDPRNERDAAGEAGVTGVLHVTSAHFGPARLLHLSVNGEYFHGNDYPVVGATNTRTAAVFALGYNFLDWLQGYASYAVNANTNSRSAPHLIQNQGDGAFGIAVSKDVARGLDLGLDLRGLILPGTGNQDLSRSGFGFNPRALLTYDVHALSPSIPLRTHLNVGFVFDKISSSSTVGRSLNAAEEFALEANRYNRFTLGAALEAPLPVATPFIEYNLGVPMGAHGLVRTDNTPTGVASAAPQTLGLGVRVTAVQDITFNAAFDIGLSKTVAYGVPATMPYNFIFGAAYTLDPFGATRTKVVEKTYERPTAVAAAPNSGRIEGTVIDASTGLPVGGAIITVADQNQPPVASDAADGRFQSYDLPPGAAHVTVQHSGYQAATADATIETGKSAQLQIRLTPEAKPAEVRTGALAVKVTAKKKAIKANVEATGGAGGPVAIEANGAAAKLPAGHYTVNVTAEGYEPASGEIDVAADKTATEKFELKKAAPAEAPKRQLVVIVKNKIVIKEQVHFATNKATILRDSFGLLNQVADSIKSNDLKHVVVEGHTDNVGSKDTNMKLSQARAEAVRSYLVKHGIAASVLEAKGYGDTKPIAPNMTAKGRELNRRVEFTITDR